MFKYIVGVFVGAGVWIGGLFGHHQPPVQPEVPVQEVSAGAKVTTQTPPPVVKKEEEVTVPQTTVIPQDKIAQVQNKLVAANHLLWVYQTAQLNAQSGPNTLSDADTALVGTSYANLFRSQSTGSRQGQLGLFNLEIRAKILNAQQAVTTLTQQLAQLGGSPVIAPPVVSAPASVARTMQGGLTVQSSGHAEGVIARYVLIADGDDKSAAAVTFTSSVPIENAELFYQGAELGSPMSGTTFSFPTAGMVFSSQVPETLELRGDASGCTVSGSFEYRAYQIPQGSGTISLPEVTF